MSKLLDSVSLPSTKSELDFFSVPVTQVAVKRGFYDEVQLVNACNDEGPYHFKLAPDPYLIQWNKNYIYMVLRIV